VNWDAIGAIGEIVGAVAVVLTLIYLASQVRQARNDQKVAAIRTTRNIRREWSKFVVDSPYVPKIVAKAAQGETLTGEEELRLTGLNSLQWGMLYGEWIDRQMNLPGEFATSDEANIKFAMSIPGFHHYLETFAKGVYPGEFIAYMEKRMLELAKEPEIEES